MYSQMVKQINEVVSELISAANIKSGETLVIGCSTSEIVGSKIGTDSVPEVAEAIFKEIYKITSECGIYVASQCCEHLNRAIIIEKELADKKGLEIVNVVPKPKAGGSFATAAYKTLKNPVAVELIKADAGLDIGLTMIGMHLKAVAVPLRLKNNRVGEALVTAARTRPKFIGGPRAVYSEDM